MTANFDAGTVSGCVNCDGDFGEISNYITTDSYGVSSPTGQYRTTMGIDLSETTIRSDGTVTPASANVIGGSDLIPTGGEWAGRFASRKQDNGRPVGFLHTAIVTFLEEDGSQSIILGGS